jgi:hypothetical protein
VPISPFSYSPYPHRAVLFLRCSENKNRKLIFICPNLSPEFTVFGFPFVHFTICYVQKRCFLDLEKSISETDLTEMSRFCLPAIGLRKAFAVEHLPS